MSSTAHTYFPFTKSLRLRPSIPSFLMLLPSCPLQILQIFHPSYLPVLLGTPLAIMQSLAYCLTLLLLHPSSCRSLPAARLESALYLFSEPPTHAVPALLFNCLALPFPFRSLRADTFLQVRRKSLKLKKLIGRCVEVWHQICWGRKVEMEAPCSAGPSLHSCLNFALLVY